MILSIIVAVSENNVIGKDNSLVWHLPADMKYFKEKTTGHCIITGRKNYESIPEKFRPLPNRTNIIVTRQPYYKADGAIIANSIEDALSIARINGEKEVFIIGGAEIYKQTLPIADKLYLTRINENFDGDAYFPEVNPLSWKELSRENCNADLKNKFNYSFLIYERTRK